MLGSSMKTTVTPWSGSSCGAPTPAPSVSRYCADGGGEVGHGDGDVVEATDHRACLPAVLASACLGAIEPGKGRAVPDGAALQPLPRAGGFGV